MAKQEEGTGIKMLEATEHPIEVQHPLRPGKIVPHVHRLWVTTDMEGHITRVSTHALTGEGDRHAKAFVREEREPTDAELEAGYWAAIDAKLTHDYVLTRGHTNAFKFEWAGQTFFGDTRLQLLKTVAEWCAKQQPMVLS